MRSHLLTQITQLCFSDWHHIKREKRSRLFFINTLMKIEISFFICCCSPQCEATIHLTQA